MRSRSRRSTQSSGRKPRTSPAIRHGKPALAKRVIGPMPERPAHTASQFAGTPTPSGVTMPSPVTTTRLMAPLGSSGGSPRPR